jgi:hypothetical protein
MTKDEALRLALEALKVTWYHVGTFAPTDEAIELYDEAITAIKAALEAKDEAVAFKIYKPTPPRGAIPNVRDAELPWVYDQDPSSGNVASMWVTPVKATLSKQAEKPEPVAWMYDWTTSEGEFIQNWTTSENESLRDTEPNIITNVRPLYAIPQPCPTCEALARTVMMDQTGRDL